MIDNNYGDYDNECMTTTTMTTTLYDDETISTTTIHMIIIVFIHLGMHDYFRNSGHWQGRSQKFQGGP